MVYTYIIKMYSSFSHTDITFCIDVIQLTYVSPNFLQFFSPTISTPFLWITMVSFIIPTKKFRPRKQIFLWLGLETCFSTPTHDLKLVFRIFCFPNNNFATFYIIFQNIQVIQVRYFKKWISLGGKMTNKSCKKQHS